MNLNVFRWTFRPRYYLAHPWKWVKELFNIIRAAWMRATKGYCYSDCWNFNSYFCAVVPLILRRIADDGMAYPGSEPFDTKEKWKTWLHEMADKIERLDYDDWMEDNNEYSKEYEETFEDACNKNELEIENIREKYYARCAEIHETRQQALEEVFKSFGQAFDCLWD